ncbi:hypothetical protein GCM10011339_23480 [Echinicola rosea]|uniref:Uncharacterized protein n=1 Tax=Echinicola rosea TaxID=1807691 RepID=A0ABQ1V476_9BACT|nr:hypothetical protein GCM10011339_23480 [Echinicola rosea]
MALNRDVLRFLALKMLPNMMKTYPNQPIYSYFINFNEGRYQVWMKEVNGEWEMVQFEKIT